MSIKNKNIDRNDKGKIKRKYTNPARKWHCHYLRSSGPKWHRKMFMTRPARYRDKEICRFIAKVDHEASDDLCFSLVKKPCKYYW